MALWFDELASLAAKLTVSPSFLPEAFRNFEVTATSSALSGKSPFTSTG